MSANSTSDTNTEYHTGHAMVAINVAVMNNPVDPSNAPLSAQPILDNTAPSNQEQPQQQQRGKKESGTDRNTQRSKHPDGLK
jgi:hypothetical protein